MIAYKVVVTVIYALGLWYQLAWAVAGFQAGAKKIAWAYVAGLVAFIALVIWTWKLGC